MGARLKIHNALLPVLEAPGVFFFLCTVADLIPL
jgi:hypothetical protein